jgi:5-methylcytosine-specific restriction protein B
LKVTFGALGWRLDDYLEEIRYRRWNGIASIQQGGISEQAFEKLRQDAQFWPFFVQGLRLAGETTTDELITSAYTALMGWMDQFAKDQGIGRRFPAFVNRFLAACLPGRVTSIAAPGRLADLITALNAWEAYQEFRGDEPDSWLRQNRFLLRSLENGLDNQHQADDTPSRRSIFFWWLYENIVADDASQLVFFGSPGTGKTYAAKQHAEQGIAAWGRLHPGFDGGDKEVIQFHPSYTYEDFIEGIRPRGISARAIQLALVPGVFKRFCKEAAKWEIDFWNKAGRPLTDRTTIQDLPANRDPGLWRFLDDQPKNDLIVTHLPPFYFIIDEINRAELSRVLGETMLVLEYRGAKDKIQTQYSSLVSDPEAAFLFSDGADYFFVPYNVRIIGTMNVIDRSVEAFDFALRRRFRWKELTFKEDAMREILADKSENDILLATRRFIGLNERIVEHPLLGRDYQVGHAYAKRLQDYGGPGGMRAALRFVWQNHLEPLLREYLRGLGHAQRLDETIQHLEGDFSRL